jgi:hypothetical protein
MKKIQSIFIIYFIVISPSAFSLDFGLLYGNSIDRFSYPNIDKAVEAVYKIETTPLEQVTGITDKLLQKLEKHITSDGRFLEIHMGEGISRLLLIPKEVSWKKIAESKYFRTGTGHGLDPEYQRREPGMQKLLLYVDLLEQKAKKCEKSK